MPDSRIAQANNRIVTLLRRLSPKWTKIDTSQGDRLDNAALYLLCGAGLLELRFQGRAWTNQNALDVQVTASGVWIDQDRKSILPEEIRGAIPAWHGRAVAVEMQPLVQVRLTTFGQEQQSELADHADSGALFVHYLCLHPVKGHVAVRILGNQGPAPGAVQQDQVEGAVLGALKDIAASIREGHVARRAAVPTEPKGNSPRTIIYHGNGTYSIGDDTLRLTESEDCVLQAFLDYPAMAKDQLIANSGFDKAVDVLRSLRKKHNGVFAEAITMPGARGRGGYRVRIARAGDCN
jgi:hypothetical protein